jgi:plastocyanin
MVFFRSVIGVAALVATVAAVPVPVAVRQYGSSGYGSSGSSGYSGSSDNSGSGYSGSSDNSGYSGSSDNSGYSGSSGNSGYSGSNDNSGYNNNNNNYNTETQDATSTSTYNNNYNTQTSAYNNNNYNTQTEDATSTSFYNNNNNNYQTTSSSNNNYQSSSSSYNNNNYNTQTEDATSTSTSTSFQTYSSPSYGSGNSNWGGNDYNNCVNQCLASNSAPPAMYTPSATVGSGNGQYGGQAGTNGVTHTVIVAPTQGVLRYVPFALNASVGDTIMFKWGANNHTVTKSSELLPCNKTADTPFASGEQNEGFIFNQVVNDTSTNFFYCGTPKHCEKGMFGIINPPSAFGSSSSVGNAMVNLVSNSSTLAAAMTYTNNITAGNVRAASWGSNIDLSTLPAWSHELVAENTLFTRAFLAANPEVYSADGSIDLSGSTPFMIPTDVAGALNAASNAAVNATTVAGAAASATASAHNGARGLAAPSMFLAVVSVAVTLFL